MKNLIISDLRTKEMLAGKRRAEQIDAAGFHGYMTAVRMVDDKFEGIEFELSLGYMPSGRFMATIELFEPDACLFLEIFPGEPTYQLLERVRDRVLAEVPESNAEVESLCASLLNA